ncbi:glycosyltransferase family 4 protein [Clostridium sp. NSJ-49]|uniref:glycosyltransferase family 4 protein n=1 Tax=Clostridium TaxID=1485 RepID=UPI00164A508F|nr:glycosyltransferase family 4 protein [Clostridium sp. NSJ-49]MBC5624102.1 glycosyltransferase family 4 protein [Clostridium sp. NSJ-49]
MNVLMLGPSKDSMGGISTVIKNFYENFKFDDINIIYMATWKEGKLRERLIFTISIILKIIKIIIKEKIDILHIHVAQDGSFYRKSLIIIIAKLFRKKVLLHIHASQFDKFYEKSNIIIRIYIKFILSLPNKLIVLSQQWEEFYKKITNNKIVVINNAVSIDEYKYNENGEIICFFGRLGKRKGIYDLLKVVDNILEKHKNIQLYLCGDGEIENVKRIILEKKLENRIIVTGWINKEEKEKILNNSIINILPSYNEGMPMAILETMARGIPNISTNIGGIPNVIKHNYNGMLISPGDLEELSKIIDYLISNKQIRTELSKNAYNTIKCKFSIDNYNNNFRNVYKSI